MTDGGAKALLQTATGDPGLELALGDTPLGQRTVCSILEIPARCKRLTGRVTKKASFRSPPAANSSAVAHLSPFPATRALTADAARVPQTANLRRLCRCFYY
ncbi:hypothetical protein [Kamptonema formosum]|uniref:hypothetical protein n=1 Tax=Kamptonema formosum TaxID=331992 RepID=UPI0012DEDA09|nr:hypothetical protein [Oscillatoria sp. PCC 10802]